MNSQSTSIMSASSKKVWQSRTLEQRQRFWGWVFLSPWIIGFLAFTAFPIGASLIFSFTDFKIGEEISWAGLKNWQTLVSDPITLQSLGVTVKFGLISLPVSILFPLMLAALLNSKYVSGKPILRVLFYMPYMVPAISGVFIWQSFLNGQTGWLNRLLRLIGVVDPPNWLFDATWIHPAMVLIGLWGVGNAMLTMLASMQGVPTELYEAADVDGAGPLTKFRRITLPMISPVILYNLVLTTIGLMQYFVVPFVLSSTTRSNPDTNFINLFLYRTAFQYFDMGYAAALAWFLFAIGLLLTIVIFATSRRWVYYAGGDT
ncbi:MAG: sugar ABC transporter permease [Anaerolineae bacterium]|nr:sugar ABC transporter permease [Anaerolineae bacterium]